MTNSFSRMYNFSYDQLQVFKRIMDAINGSKPIFLFVSGTAGSGKTHLIRALVDEIGMVHVSVNAPTGFAAKLIGGRTIHSFLKLPLGSDDNSVLKLIIIDEISMCSAELLDQLEAKLSAARKNRGPFGGYCVVCFGDLFQIPPVRARWVFESKWWQTLFEYAELTSNHRQHADPVFAQILQRWRIGRMTAEDRDFLMSRVIQGPAPLPMRLAQEYIRANQDASMILVHNNFLCRFFNNQISRLLFDDLLRLTTLTMQFRQRDGVEVAVGGPTYQDPVCVAIDSKVMVTKNLRCGLRNGETARIVEIEGNATQIKRVIVASDTGAQHKIHRSRSSRFCRKWSTRYANIAIPLIPAYAVTYHKSQGQTLDAVFLHLKDGPDMPASMLFVGASRVRRREDFFITKLDPNFGIKVDQRVVDEYNRLRATIGLGEL